MADIRAVERCELLELSFDDAWPLIRQVPAASPAAAAQPFRQVPTLWGVLEDITQIRSERARKHAPPASTRLERKVKLPKYAGCSMVNQPGQCLIIAPGLMIRRSRPAAGPAGRAPPPSLRQSRSARPLGSH
eukprot:751231-Hanusia_phi.AAC.4